MKLVGKVPIGIAILILSNPTPSSSTILSGLFFNMMGSLFARELVTSLMGNNQRTVIATIPSSNSTMTVTQTHVPTFNPMASIVQFAKTLGLDERVNQYLVDDEVNNCDEIDCLNRNQKKARKKKRSRKTSESEEFSQDSEEYSKYLIQRQNDEDPEALANELLVEEDPQNMFFIMKEKNLKQKQLRKESRPAFPQEPSQSFNRRPLPFPRGSLPIFIRFRKKAIPQNRIHNFRRSPQPHNIHYIH